MNKDISPLYLTEMEIQDAVDLQQGLPIHNHNDASGRSWGAPQFRVHVVEEPDMRKMETLYGQLSGTKALLRLAQEIR